VRVATLPETTPAAMAAVNSAHGPTLVTLGCRLNAVESEVMRAHALAAGLDDVVIVNTCAVTSQAVRQATQTIRRLRRDRPDAVIVVTGCAAQIEPERFAEIDGVDHVVGNAEKTSAETFRAIAAARNDGARNGAARRDRPSPAAEVRVGDIMTVRETARHLIDGFGGRARAIVEVQNGCDHRCTFCIIPFGRGPSRSVRIAEVVAQVRRHVEAGRKEIVLTGVDMTSYGGDLPGAPTLGHLVRQVLAEVPELPRLRLSSIDQVEADDDLMRALAEEERLMPHLHLSLQSGDDMILKRMKRRHTRADAVQFAERARRLRPDVVFGADIIAGFPTETEDMFARSLDIVDDCNLTYLHVFPFSPRRGTPAARMPQVHTATVTERAARLRAKGESAHRAYLERQVGTSTTILVEAPDMGRTPQYAEVAFAPSAASGLARHGELMHVTIAGVAGGRHGSGRRLRGVPV